MTLKQNLVVGQGETLTLNITYTDSNDTPVDLTGHTVDLIISSISTGDVVGTYPATVDASGGIAVKVQDETTASFDAVKHAYRVEHTSPDGDVKWLLYGALIVMSGVRV